MTRLAFVLCAIGFGAVACKKTEKPTPWTPGIAYSTPTEPVYRNFVEVRGLIHAHNVHSWDACDEKPILNGKLNAGCYSDFRGDLCESKLDFIFMSDHTSNFNTTEYPNNQAAGTEPMDNTLEYDPTMGDQLIVRNGNPVANNVEISCGDHRRHLLMGGNEGDNLLTAGLETHVAPLDTANPSDPGDLREAIYDAHTDQGTFPANVPQITQAIQTDQAHGAVVMVAHPEDLTGPQLATYPLDGFEMYNIHANTLFTTHGQEAVLSLIFNMQVGGDLNKLPDNANTIFLGIFSEDPNYMTRWAYALSQPGVKRTMFMGSDIHENAIPTIMSTSIKPTFDNMRGDRYQRLMKWFSNHLLITPNADGSWDDSNLKAALKAGRLFGVFEAFGYPIGFDYHATVGSTITEMGGDVDLSSNPVLSVKLPEVENLNKSEPAPVFTTRILLADGENWDVMASGPGDVSFTPTKPGSYRAEVRVMPYHLTKELGPMAQTWLSHDYVWIYSNAVYVH
jgi:hypothetical protein